MHLIADGKGRISFFKGVNNYRLTMFYGWPHIQIGLEAFFPFLIKEREKEVSVVFSIRFLFQDGPSLYQVDI